MAAVICCIYSNKVSYHLPFTWKDPTNQRIFILFLYPPKIYIYSPFPVPSHNLLKSSDHIFSITPPSASDSNRHLSTTAAQNTQPPEPIASASSSQHPDHPLHKTQNLKKLLKTIKLQTGPRTYKQKRTKFLSLLPGQGMMMLGVLGLPTSDGSQSDVLEDFETVSLYCLLTA